MARSIQQIDDAIVVRELHHRGRHRDTALLFHRHPITRSVLVAALALNRARHLNEVAQQYQFLGDRRLTRIRMRDDGEGAPLIYFC